METPQLGDDPPWLKTLVQELAKALPFGADGEKAGERLRQAWSLFRREAENSLESLLDALPPDLNAAEEHYSRKLNLLRRERKWLRRGLALRSRKLAIDRRYADSLRCLDEVKDDRMTEAKKLVFPDFPDTQIRLGDTAQSLIAEVHRRFLASDRSFGRMVEQAVAKIVSSHSRQQGRRWLYSVAFERFWGVLVLSLLVEQVAQKWLEEHVVSRLVDQLSGAIYWRIGVLLLLLFVAYETKERWLNPPIKKRVERYRVRQLTLNIVEAAAVQTKVEAMYIVLDAWRAFEEVTQRSGASNTSQAPDAEHEP